MLHLQNHAQWSIPEKATKVEFLHKRAEEPFQPYVPTAVHLKVFDHKFNVVSYKGSGTRFKRFDKFEKHSGAK